MRNSCNIRSEVTSVLIKRYSEFNTDFKKDDCDYEMLDSFYEVIGDVELEGLVTMIDSYLSSRSVVLKQIIHQNSVQFIFNQPAFLFVFFSLFHWNNKIINDWPYDYESLLSVLRWSGFSANVLYES